MYAVHRTAFKIDKNLWLSSSITVLRSRFFVILREIDRGLQILTYFDGGPGQLETLILKCISGDETGVRPKSLFL